jgi:uncharacterized protein (DUF302 family)
MINVIVLGVELGTECRLYEICNPKTAKDLLDVNFSLITILPCKVAVYLSKENGKVMIETQRPSIAISSLGVDSLHDTGKELDGKLEKIIDEASKSE